jgi:hypothetical protein
MNVIQKRTILKGYQVTLWDFRAAAFLPQKTPRQSPTAGFDLTRVS